MEFVKFFHYFGLMLGAGLGGMSGLAGISLL